MRHACALIIVLLAGHSASARGDADIDALLVDVHAFCSAMIDAPSRTLDLAEQRLEAIKREIEAIATLRVKRERTAADAAAARSRVANQRRAAEELKTRLSHLSPTMVEDRRLVGADLAAHLEVLDRYRQTEAVLAIELAGIDAEITAKGMPALATVSTSEADLRRCIAEGRRRLK